MGGGVGRGGGWLCLGESLYQRRALAAPLELSLELEDAHGEHKRQGELSTGGKTNPQRAVRSGGVRAGCRAGGVSVVSVVSGVSGGSSVSGGVCVSRRIGLVRLSGSGACALPDAVDHAHTPQRRLHVVQHPTCTREHTL